MENESRPSAGASTHVRTQYGFAAESLPFVETVSPHIRRQIVEGKDANLATLLIPYHTGTNIDFEKGKTDPILNKSLTLGEFIQAFGIYKNLMGEVFP